MLGGCFILVLAFAGIVGLGWWGVSALVGGSDEPERRVVPAESTPEWDPRLSSIKVGCNVANGLRGALASMDEQGLEGWNLQAFAEPYDALLQSYAQQTARAMVDFDGSNTAPILRPLDRYRDRCRVLLGGTP